MTDLALHTIKGHCTGHRQLKSPWQTWWWKITFFDFPLKGLFGPAVDGFAEWFMAAHKSSQAMRHSLQKRSSLVAGTGLQKASSCQQSAKPVPPPAQQIKLQYSEKNSSFPYSIHCIFCSLMSGN